MPQAVTDIAVHRLSPALGAEVVGLDLAHPLDAPTVARVREAFQEHHMLCFRDQRLGDDQLTAASGSTSGCGSGPISRASATTIAGGWAIS